MSPHRIDIEAAVDEWLAIHGDYNDDARDDLLAVIYGWRDEQLTDARRSVVLAVSPAVTERPEVLHWAHYEDDECIEDCPGCLRDEVIEALTDDESSYVGELEPADLVDRFVAAIRAEPYPFPASPAVTEGERTGRRVPPPNYALAGTVSDELGVRAAPSPAVTAAEDETWGREKPHTLTRYGTTNCPVEGIRANVDDGECSACGAPVVAAVPAEPPASSYFDTLRSMTSDPAVLAAADRVESEVRAVPADPNEKD